MASTRRVFLLSAPPLLARRKARAVRRKRLIVLVDGFGPDYLAKSEMPNLKRMAAAGSLKTGQGVIPSVTNVNNASLVTGSFPAEHGITSNFYYDPRSGKSVQMEAAEFLLRPTVFERAAAVGIASALVTAKDKVRTLLSRGAAVAVSAENPPREWIERVGPRPDMYSAAANYWALRAARHLLRDPRFGLVYLSTTDYMMHTYAPEEAPSLEHLHTLDRLLGEIAGEQPDLELYLTADHGMNAKAEAVDLARALAARGVAAEAVPIIRDKHVVHHRNLGGACYVYLHRREEAAKAHALLQGLAGVEEVYGNQEAARRFRLRADRIGDLLALGAKHTAFGALPAERETVKIRSHGSRHEAAVPILVYGRKVDWPRYEWNLDLTRYLDWEAQV
jgi:phosphonoacetate hydrolase